MTQEKNALKRKHQELQDLQREYKEAVDMYKAKELSFLEQQAKKSEQQAKKSRTTEQAPQVVVPPLDGMKELLAGFTASIGKRIDALADQVQTANKNAEEAKRLAQNKSRGNALQQRLLERVDKQGVIEALAAAQTAVMTKIAEASSDSARAQVTPMLEVSSYRPETGGKKKSKKKPKPKKPKTKKKPKVKPEPLSEDEDTESEEQIPPTTLDSLLSADDVIIEKCPVLSNQTLKPGVEFLKFFGKENGWSRGKVCQYRDGKKKSNVEVHFRDDKPGQLRNCLLKAEEYHTRRANPRLGSWFLLKIQPAKNIRARSVVAT